MSNSPQKPDRNRSRTETGGDKRARTRSHVRSDAHSHIRSRLAQEAARLISAGEAGNYPQARRKAAQRLGVLDKAVFPANQDIDEALREYQRLFRPETGAVSHRYREAALEAMEFLAAFRPRLTGPVLDATADSQAVVTLHLHEDDSDAVALYLEDQGIPADADIVRLRPDAHREEVFPVWRFFAGDVPFEVIGLPALLVRQAPLASGDDQPMRRASASQLRRLMQDEAEGPSAIDADVLRDPGTDA